MVMGSATISAIIYDMPRISRVDVGGEIYHVLNRSNARVQIFDNDKDYQQFEAILEEAVKKYDMRLLAYIVMPITGIWYSTLQKMVTLDFL